MKLADRKAMKQDKKKKRFLYRLSILLVLIGAVVFVLISNAKKDQAVYKPGDMAPDFKLQQINPVSELESIQLTELRGKGVMLNFWATYCKPCEKEMPYMQGLYEEYKDKGIEIVAINLDGQRLVAEQFVKKYELNFPVVLDDKKLIRELYNIGPIPSSIFIDQNGKIIERIEGQLSLEQLEGYFQEIQPK